MDIDKKKIKFEIVINKNKLMLVWRQQTGKGGEEPLTWTEAQDCIDRERR